MKKLTDTELALICAKTECRFCEKEVKKQCLTNKCWSSPDLHDRNCPAVYYGITKRCKA